MAQAGDRTLKRHGRSWGPWLSLHLDWQGIKAQGFLCSGSLLRGTQLKLLFCYCTMIKLFQGTKRLGLCYGKSVVKPLRKPCLTRGSGVCRESSRAPISSVESPAVQGLLSQHRECECDCQGGMVRQESFLNRSLALLCCCGNMGEEGKKNVKERREKDKLQDLQADAWSSSPNIFVSIPPSPR